LSSVVIKSIDRRVIEQAVREYTAELQANHPEIEQIIWFGSWVGGLPTPGSDVDLCLILSDSDKPFRERIPDYLPLGFPVGIDLFPYTRAELEQLKKRSPHWYAAIRAGQTLLN
jgi:uncharacterized protein